MRHNSLMFKQVLRSIFQDAARQQELDQAAEGQTCVCPSIFFWLSPFIASRAYKQAVATLATLTAHPPSFTFDPSLINNGNSKSIFSAFLPNLQGQGPIGSALRIFLKLHYHTVRRLSIALGLGQETIGMGSRRKDEEQRLKAIKVLDLLLHSAELGNTDALFTLAKVSLVSLASYPLPWRVFTLSSSHPHNISHRTRS